MKLKDFINKTFNNILSNNKKSEIKNKNEHKQTTIYSKTFTITHSDTDSRQKIIKELIKENELSLSEDLEFEPLFCSSEIEEGTMLSGKKCLKVITIYNDFICELGYIPKEFEPELYDALNNSDNYTTSLYVTKKNNIYYIQLEIEFFKNK